MPTNAAFRVEFQRLDLRCHGSTCCLKVETTPKVLGRANYKRRGEQGSAGETRVEQETSVAYSHRSFFP